MTRRHGHTAYGLNAGPADHWRDYAACRDADPELFFPTFGGPPGARQFERAKAVCDRCPVASTCLAWALDNGVGEGIWGGKDARERRRLSPQGRANRRSDECRRGHRWTPENTGMRHGKRYCRACERPRAAESMRRRRGAAHAA